MPLRFGFLKSCHRHQDALLLCIPITIALFVIPRLSDLPPFCDEMLIGLHANDTSSLRTLFYDHFDTVAGSLPVITTAPFVALFGLNDVSIRLPPLVFTFAAAATMWRALIRLRAPAPWLGVLIFLGTPQVLHMARINFGHAPSLFLLSMGIWLWARRRGRLAAITAGIC